ncbi:exosomal 3'-5' exoribonuclease [Schizosaccharomyces japonicus yFS275]|uniref:Exosomal 3'-5' exoribonuclease n=1 Tax=Schizosaccharomyces japonicus (strain yFS275 / FY16936) TaxID=402676 RepID=B6JWS8_SCHJY|nr:exosomal 3'-5' exoribonuclease [Schizosaccharomyces japonicus yFS275]EEB05829.2 exosomal 3'-5' exoribonuclease [Schizosaccharomyces japonicus yFS275]
MTDRRRINGPAVSTPPVYEDHAFIKRTRDSDTCRRLFLQLGWTTKANGNAYLESGNIKIACSVFGPRPTKTSSFHSIAKLTCELKFSPFAQTVRKSNVQDINERDFSQHIERSLAPSIMLHLYPKSSIDVYIQILESDGQLATIAAAITCASLAIANAKIDCIDIVTGASALYKQPSASCIVDPEESDERDADRSTSFMLVGYMASLGQVTEVWTEGSLSSTDLSKLLEKCTDVASKTRLVANNVLAETEKKSIRANRKR